MSTNMTPRNCVKWLTLSVKLICEQPCNKGRGINCAASNGVDVRVTVEQPTSPNLVARSQIDLLANDSSF